MRRLSGNDLVGKARLKRGLRLRLLSRRRRRRVRVRTMALCALILCTRTEIRLPSWLTLLSVKKS